MKAIKIISISAWLLSLISPGKAATYPLYGVNTLTDQVVSINRQTGSVSPLFTLPFDISSNSGFDYNPADGFLYAAYNDATSIYFYKCDLSENTATLSKTIPSVSSSGITSIGFTSSSDVYVWHEVFAFNLGTLFLADWESGVLQTIGQSGTPNMFGGDYDEIRGVYWATDEWNAKAYQLSTNNASIVATSVSTWFTGNGPGAVLDMDVDLGGNVLISATDDNAAAAKLLQLDVESMTWTTLATIEGGSIDYRIATVPEPATGALLLISAALGVVAFIRHRRRS